MGVQYKELCCLTVNSGTRFSGTAAGRILHVWTTVAPLNTTQTRQTRSLWLEVAARTFSGRKTCLKWAVGCETHRTVKLLSSVRELRLLVSCSLQHRNRSPHAQSVLSHTLEAKQRLVNVQKHSCYAEGCCSGPSGARAKKSATSGFWKSGIRIDS